MISLIKNKAVLIKLTQNYENKGVNSVMSLPPYILNKGDTTYE
ncbi:hypothetical protein SpAn4DRAFT_1954 [Sporomusa ovata]|uniref:Uncharacterized protein n=1 Tax=Sporomusa ovata TaxID=2378 RepID=A0A0U1KU71_9FIRM|nr:hypothetical protein SpAn4DRAFT_1954 [Sporomusa ovata]